MMDPHTQQCYGFYLYGAGHQSRNDNTLGLITGNPRGQQPHYCLRCPKRADCEDEMEKRVRADRPEAAERFDRLMAAALRKGYPPTLAARLIGKNRDDPFAEDAIANFARGHAERGLGPLIGR